jgi:hypothetical protein
VKGRRKEGESREVEKEGENFTTVQEQPPPPPKKIFFFLKLVED